MSGCWLFSAMYCCIIGVCATLAILVQLHLGIGLAADRARKRVERHAPEAEERPDVQPVERDVEHLREPAFDPEGAARDKPHERPPRLVVAERAQRAEIAVVERLRLPPRQEALDGLHEVARLLVGRL